MAGFDDSLVREYFEMNGFFVRQSRKYTLFPYTTLFRSRKSVV